MGAHIGGAEFHTYIALGPKGVPIPKENSPHVTLKFGFYKEEATLSKAANNVTSDGHKMMQQGYDFYFTDHVPVPVGFPHPLEIPQLAKVVAGSGSKLQMASMSVTSGGNPLACCLWKEYSANLNCSDPVDVPLNLVVNLSSVITSPTAGDYAGALASATLDTLFNLGFGRLLKKVGVKNDWLEIVAKHLFRRAPDVLPFLEAPAKSAAEFVKQAVDGKGGAQ
jgi:hypothetical protein